MSNVSLINGFSDAMWLEEGLSHNTIESYRNDLRQFSLWLSNKAKSGGKLIDATYNEINKYLICRIESRNKLSTVSRLVSTLKRFYRFLLCQGRIQTDPTLNIVAPKLSRRTIISLAKNDVKLLLAAPNINQPLGMRDRTMLEVLYASGLRVSELVNLKTSQVRKGMGGVVHVRGKGDKERLVPLGEEVLAWVSRYNKQAKPMLLNGKTTEMLFITSRGTGMTRQAFWYIIRRHASHAGLSELPSSDNLRQSFRHIY